MNRSTNLVCQERQHFNIFFGESGRPFALNIERGAYFGMNPVAGEIWDMLEAPHSPQQVIQKLMALYEVDAETCQTETLQVLQRMARLKLVEVAG